MQSQLDVKKKWQDDLCGSIQSQKPKPNTRELITMTQTSSLRSSSHRLIQCFLILAAILSSFVGLGLAGTAWAASSNKSLQIYFVDVEGGQSTLFVTPAGQSLLIDTGWPDNNGRDADRIVAAARKAILPAARSLCFVRHAQAPTNLNFTIQGQVLGHSQT